RSPRGRGVHAPAGAADGDLLRPRGRLPRHRLRAAAAEPLPGRRRGADAAHHPGRHRGRPRAAPAEPGMSWAPSAVHETGGTRSDLGVTRAVIRSIIAMTCAVM